MKQGEPKIIETVRSRIQNSGNQSEHPKKRDGKKQKNSLKNMAVRNLKTDTLLAASGRL
jgi:hypothetical protein